MDARRRSSALLCAFALALLAAPAAFAAPVAPATSPPQATPTRTFTLTGLAQPAIAATFKAPMTEDFEGAWPGDGWQIVDAGGRGYSWLKRHCPPHAGMYGGSMVSPPYGGLPSCSTRYPNSASVAAVYGPFDLGDASAASLSFYLYGVSEKEADFLFVASSADGRAFDGRTFSGNLTQGPDGNGYTRYTLDLGDRLGAPQVWLAFWFQSDAGVNDIGFTVDDIALDVTRGAPPTPVPPPDAPGRTTVFLPIVTAPSPGRIAYTHHQTSERYSIYVINPDGSGKRRVVGCQPESVAGMSVESCGAAWSPDRRRIAFHSKLDGDTTSHIYLVDAAGGTPVRLTADDLADDAFPVWSPDGSRIAFVRNRAGDAVLTASVYTVGVDGTGLQRVASDGMFVPIDWSPDGAALAYSCVLPERKNTGLCAIGPNGAGRKILVDDAQRGEIAPAWSQDSRLAYISVAYSASRTDPVVRMMLYQGDLHVIVDGVDRVLVKDVVAARGVAWSPDGGEIAFGRRYGQALIARERSDLYAIAADGSTSRAITSYDGVPREQLTFDIDPSWR